MISSGVARLINLVICAGWRTGFDRAGGPRELDSSRCAALLAVKALAPVPHGLGWRAARRHRVSALWLARNSKSASHLSWRHVNFVVTKCDLTARACFDQSGQKLQLRCLGGRALLPAAGGFLSD